MHTVERALQLARLGKCRSIGEIEKQLRKEGYSSVIEHLAGYGIRKQLRGLMAMTGAEAGDRAVPAQVRPLPAPAAAR